MTVSQDMVLRRTDEHPALPAQLPRVRPRLWPLVGVTVAAMGLVTLGAFSQPTHWSVEVEHHVEADPALVYAWIAAPVTWTEWADLPDRKVRLIGPEVGAGAGISWAADGGRQRLVLTAADPRSGVRYEIRDSGGAVVEVGEVSLSGASEASQLTWTARGMPVSNVLLRYGVPGDQQVREQVLGASLGRVSALAEADHERAFRGMSEVADEPLIPTLGVPMAPGLSMEFD